jgi:hypothetical protein
MIRAPLYLREVVGSGTIPSWLWFPEGWFQGKAMDRDVVMHQMHVLSREGTERFEELYAKALDAVEQAPDGPWISAGEFAFLEVFRELLRESFEAALQARIDTHSSAARIMPSVGSSGARRGWRISSPCPARNLP